MPLSVDQIRALQTQVTIPPGNVAPTYLTWLGPTDDDVNWTSGPDDEILKGSGTPNALVFAPKGTLYEDYTTPGLYQNTDGQSAWSAVGGSSGFPITADDGTNTALISFTSHNLISSNTLDSGSALRSRLRLNGDGSAYVEANHGGGAFLNSVGSTAFVTGGGAFINDDGGGVFITSTNSSYGGRVDVLAAKGAQETHFKATSNTGLTEARVSATNATGTAASMSVYGVASFYSVRTLEFVGQQNAWFGFLAAPSTADLGSSAFGFWLDDTPGATKFNIKGVDSGGTVRTASIALT